VCNAHRGSLPLTTTLFIIKWQKMQAFREAEAAAAAAELREERGAAAAGADAREVARVLAAPGDYEVLSLALCVWTHSAERSPAVASLRCAAMY